jgi:uncharacterized protein YqgV (UPF0045/DUF77 family)
MPKTFAVNAAIQIIPIKTTEPLPFIDEAIALIESKGLQYDVGPFSTSIEGDLDTIFELVEAIRTKLFEKGLDEFLVNLQIQFDRQKPVLAHSKTEKFKK